MSTAAPRRHARFQPPTFTSSKPCRYGGTCWRFLEGRRVGRILCPFDHTDDHARFNRCGQMKVVVPRVAVAAIDGDADRDDNEEDDDDEEEEEEEKAFQLALERAMKLSIVEEQEAQRKRAADAEFAITMASKRSVETESVTKMLSCDEFDVDAPRPQRRRLPFTEQFTTDADEATREHCERGTKECLLCFEQRVGAKVALLPCGHAMMCSACTSTVLAEPDPKCPCCRVELTGSVVIFE